MHRPDLALAVRNLAAGLERVGRHPEALAAAEEAARLYRGLVEQWPHLYAGLYADTEADIRRLEAGSWH